MYSEIAPVMDPPMIPPTQKMETVHDQIIVTVFADNGRPVRSKYEELIHSWIS